MGIEATAVKQVVSGEGRSFALMGSSITFKYEPADNRETLLAFEHGCPPGLGVPAHTEHNHEAFYVLEGALEVEIDGSAKRLDVGDFLSLAPGVVHSLRNPGPGPMRVLTMVSPGNGHVRFFSTLGEPIQDPSNPPRPTAPPDLERILRVGAECGIEFLPPEE